MGSIFRDNSTITVASSIDKAKVRVGRLAGVVDGSKNTWLSPGRPGIASRMLQYLSSLLPSLCCRRVPRVTVPFPVNFLPNHNRPVIMAFHFPVVAFHFPVSLSPCASREWRAVPLLWPPCGASFPRCCVPRAGSKIVTCTRSKVVACTRNQRQNRYLYTN